MEKRVDIIPIDILRLRKFFNLNSKKYLFYFVKIIKFLNKNFLDIYDFDIMFYNKNMVLSLKIREKN